MVATAVTIATEVGKRNSVSIWLNNRISPAGNKDTSSTLLEKVPGQGNGKSCTNARKQRNVLCLDPQPQKFKVCKARHIFNELSVSEGKFKNLYNTHMFIYNSIYIEI